MADRLATQVKMVEGYAILAIGYYLLSLLKVIFGMLGGCAERAPFLVNGKGSPSIVTALILIGLRLRKKLSLQVKSLVEFGSTTSTSAGA